MTIASVLRQNGGDVICVSPRTPVVEVARLLTRRRLGAALVVDAQRRVLGILSDRDILRAVATRAAGIADLATEALMTRNVAMVAATTPVDAALRLIEEDCSRHLPVIDAEARLVGLVSLRDLVRHRLSQPEPQPGRPTAQLALGWMH